MGDKQPRNVWPETRKGDGKQENSCKRDEAVLDWYEFGDRVVERKLTGGCKADQNVGTDELVDALCCSTHDAAYCCESCGSSEKPSTAKDVRETADQGVSNRQAERPDERDPCNVCRGA